MGRRDGSRTRSQLLGVPGRLRRSWRAGSAGQASKGGSPSPGGRTGLQAAQRPGFLAMELTLEIGESPGAFHVTPGDSQIRSSALIDRPQTTRQEISRGPRH